MRPRRLTDAVCRRGRGRGRNSGDRFGSSGVGSIGLAGRSGDGRLDSSGEHQVAATVVDGFGGPMDGFGGYVCRFSLFFRSINGGGQSNRVCIS